jgi:hypothetical protein
LLVSSPSLTPPDTLKKQANQQASEYNRLADEHIKAVSSNLKHYARDISLLTRYQTGSASDKKVD